MKHVRDISRAEYRKMNKNIPVKNDRGTYLVIGCNYHTSWQRNPGMRFTLTSLDTKKATLQTRLTNKIFTTNVNDLIFITSKHNISKAIDLREDTKEYFKNLLKKCW